MGLRWICVPDILAKVEQFFKKKFAKFKGPRVRGLWAAMDLCTGWIY